MKDIEEEIQNFLTNRNISLDETPKFYNFVEMILKNFILYGWSNEQERKRNFEILKEFMGLEE